MKVHRARLIMGEAPSPFTFSHDISATGDRIISVEVASAGSPVLSITYGGERLTKVEEIDGVGRWTLQAPLRGQAGLEIIRETPGRPVLGDPFDDR